MFFVGACSLFWPRAVFAFVGCDAGSGELAGSSGESAPTAKQSSELASIESVAELSARLSELGTRLEGSRKRQWLAEQRSVQIQGAKQAASDLGPGAAEDVERVATRLDAETSDLLLALSEGSTTDGAEAKASSNTICERSLYIFWYRSGSGIEAAGREPL
jgi:hypothetical protein